MAQKRKGGATSAAAAANAFLDLAWAEKISVGPMKLQKLLFYSHAWHLALLDQPLFDDDIEAWPWGPVVRNVYIDLTEYGKKPVDRYVTELQKVDDGPFGYKFVKPRVEDGTTLDFIRQVWDVHKGLTAIQLSNATHAPGEPWTIIREKYGSLDGKPRIPDDLISDVFKRKLDASYSNNAA